MRVLTENTVFNGTRLVKTGARHGQGSAGDALGPVSGIVFQRPGHKTTYVAGDTVWNEHIETVLTEYRPDLIVLNAGYVGASVRERQSSWARRMSSAPTELHPKRL